MSDRLDQLYETKKNAKLQYTFVPLQKISDNIKLAVIVSEDASFFDHDGVDWDEFEASLEKNLSKGKLSRGGSTISMQVSKNLFLSLSKNPLRKIREFFITAELEKQLSKKRILEIYLNIAEWGPNGIFGIEAASQYHFKKPASALTREEAARLAAILPNPIRFSPHSSSKWFNRKTRNILYLMKFYESRYGNYLDKM